MKTSYIVYSWFILFLFIINYKGFAQRPSPIKFSAGFPINYEEDSVGSYTLPDVLTLKNGKKVADVKTWTKKRRPEILASFESMQFGKMPPTPTHLSYHVFDKGTIVLEGKAIRKQVRIYLTGDTTHKLDVLFYLPAHSTKPVPLFLHVSFFDNSVAVNDSGVKPGYIWTKDGKKISASLTKNPSKLDLDKFISQGIGIATMYYGDIEPDFKQGFAYGIRQHFSKTGLLKPDEWGAISAWSWGISCVMDYFETDNQVDAKRIALFGISRLGKTVLWTGAHDTRFKVIIASCSGEGGAAISRRNYGENTKHITDTSRYFYQFAANYHNYATNINNLPVDAHMLVALIAPRALLLQTGDTDFWSDPKGEFLSAVSAEPVYNLFNLKGPGTSIMPHASDTSLLLNTLGYYMHSGGHGIVPSDWDMYILFLKKHL